MEDFFTITEGSLDLPVVLSCDHAGHELPDRYATLGLSEEFLRGDQLPVQPLARRGPRSAGDR